MTATITTNPKTLSDRDQRIRVQQTKAIARHSSGQAPKLSTITSTGQVTDGLACTVHDQRNSIRMDMGVGMGGDASAPSPGFYARAAVIGCVAIGTKMTAAREGMVLRAVDVAIETDFDDSAIFGLGNNTAAPLETRITITIDTDEPQERIDDLIARVLRADPWFLALRDAQNVATQIRLT